MTLGTAPGTRALLDLEDAAPDILFERLPGSPVPFWPQVRSQFIVAMQETDFGGLGLSAPAPSRSEVWRGLARALLPSRTDARRLRGRRPITYVVGGTTVHRPDGRERNWLVGDYLESFPEQSALLQWADHPPVAAAFQPTRSLAPAVTRSAAHARLTRSRPDPVRIGRLVRELARQLGIPLGEDRLAAITASATYAEASRPHVETRVLRILDRLQPRIVLLEDASYGSLFPLVARMKARGIRVAEPQHGWIGPSHGAYNFGAAMGTPELSAGLPDELLTFGEYWGSAIRVPFPAVAIGRPHLEARSASAAPWADRPEEVLVTSSVADPAATSDFVTALADRLDGDWRIRFRPHPIERDTVAHRYPSLLEHRRIRIDDNDDIYDSLATARGVVGVSSTVLFEALAFGAPVFARSSPYAEYYVGDVFGPLIEGPASVGLIVSALREGGQTVPQDTLEAIWKPGAIANFRGWAEDRLRDRPASAG